ncbi:hypothetical protein N0V82_002709 [Gnomoniopsis sp. IMI 355080]|nr:hypothetical protein N0V82_002709 [Gnomoniopsis sp. IMI 355080]
MMASSQQVLSLGGSGSKEPFTVRLTCHFQPNWQALDYLRAVDPRDLPQTIRDCLNNDSELYHYIAHALSTAPVQRFLVFKPDMNPGDYKHFSTLRPWYNVHALFVYVTGYWAKNACKHKGPGRSKKGCDSMFMGCVVPRHDLEYVSKAKFNTTACANHQYQCEGSKCLLNGVAQKLNAKARSSSAEAQSSADNAEPSTVEVQPAAPPLYPEPPRDPLPGPPGPCPASPWDMDSYIQYPEDHVGEGSSQEAADQDNDVPHLASSSDSGCDPTDLQPAPYVYNDDHQTTGSQVYPTSQYHEPPQVNNSPQNAYQPNEPGMENVDPDLMVDASLAAHHEPDQVNDAFQIAYQPHMASMENVDPDLMGDASLFALLNAYNTFN